MYNKYLSKNTVPFQYEVYALFYFKITRCSKRLSLNLNRLTVITMETVEKSLTTGALDGSGVLYSKNSFKTIEFINNDDIS
jgi:hypothetical protein